jgi:hypothetical protein
MPGGRATGLRQEREELTLARPDVDEAERRRDLIRESGGDAGEAPGERRVPGGAGHEVAGTPHASRPLVVPAVRVVERGLLEGVEAEGTLAPDPVEEPVGKCRARHDAILSGAGPPRQG